MHILQIRLVELRNEKELTQKELASKIGVSASAIGFWENGINEPKASYLLRIAKFFNVSTDYLVGNESDYGVIETDYIPSSQTIYAKDERQLIEKYRELNPACKKLINNTIDTLVTTSTAATEQKKRNS